MALASEDTIAGDYREFRVFCPHDTYLIAWRGNARLTQGNFHTGYKGWHKLIIARPAVERGNSACNMVR